MWSISEERAHRNSSECWIIFPGQLVRVKANCFEQSDTYGIIIECEHPDFGLGLNESWAVLVDGKINTLESFKIWPVGESVYEQQIQYQR